MELNYLKSGKGEPLIILHGLFGMLDNWKTISKTLEKYFTVYLIDQRNHGKSPQTAAHSYPLMSNDIYTFFLQQKLSSVTIIGHSMGGKAAMQFASDHTELVKKLIVVDMGMKRYSGGHDEIFDALFSVDLSKIRFRSDAEKILLDRIDDFGTRQFILKNLTRDVDGNYFWKFNLNALYENYNSQILAPVQIIEPVQIETLFIRGSNSNYIKNEDWNSILRMFPNAVLETIQDAGHWVHAEKPKEFLESVLHFLRPEDSLGK